MDYKCVLVLLLSACKADPLLPEGSQEFDPGRVDTGADTGEVDTGTDTGWTDTGEVDTGTPIDPEPSDQQVCYPGESWDYSTCFDLVDWWAGGTGLRAGRRTRRRARGDRCGRDACDSTTASVRGRERPTSTTGSVVERRARAPHAIRGHRTSRAGRRIGAPRARPPRQQSHRAVGPARVRPCLRVCCA